MFNALSSRSALLITISLSQSLPRRVPPKYICKRKIIGLTKVWFFSMRRTHIPTALLLCLSKEQRFTEKERQRTFWSALYLSLFELLSQTSWFRCLKNKILQHLPVIRTNYWCHTLFDTHRKRSCQVRLTSSPALYFRHAQKTHMLRKIDRKSRTLLGTHIKRS